ncbi:TadE family protein [Methylobacter sp. Wu1]
MNPKVSQPRAGTRRRLSCSLRKQRGAAAIEAALLFVIFFTLFYAIVSYSMPILMMQAFQHAASAGARAAVAVDPAAEGYETAAENRAKTVVAELLDDWLPKAAHEAVLGSEDGVKADFDEATRMLTVTVKFPDYTKNPLIPILKFPGIGDVPKLPNDLKASAVVQLD